MREGKVRSSVMLGVLLCAVSVMPARAAQTHTIRGHPVGHGSSGRNVVHVHGGFGFYASYYYLPHYYPYGYYYAPYPAYYAPAYLPDVAYLDTDVSPEKAEVYLDGEYVGIADDYDGFPSYLAVSPGKHTITFKENGYRSVTRSVRVPRGAVLDLEFTMPKGSGSEGPQAGEKDENEEIVVPESGHGTQPGGEYAEEDEEGAEERAEEPGFVRLDVTPPDASIYIDGKLYGSASRLSRLHGDLRMDGGKHRIEAVRPGYRGITRELDLKPGDHIVLNLELKPNAPR